MPFGNKFQLGKNYCIVPWFHVGKKCVFDDVIGFFAQSYQQNTRIIIFIGVVANTGFCQNNIDR